MKWLIRKYECGDEDNIINLINGENELGKSTKYDREYWLWKYQKNPSGLYPDILVVEDDGIVGYTGVSLREIDISGKLLKVAQLTDIIVKPSHRKQGIFKALIKNLIEKSKGNKIDLFYVFPNKKSIPGLRGENFKNILYIGEMIKVVRPVGLAKKYSRNTLSYYLFYIIFTILGLRKRKKRNEHLNSHLKVKELISFDKRFDKLWKTELGTFAFDVNQKYLVWRYNNHPKNKYSTFVIERNDGCILGYIILGLKNYSSKNNLCVGHIMDFRYLPGKTSIGNFLMSYAITYLNEMGAEMIRCYIPKRHPHYKIFKNQGFIKFRDIPFLAFLVNDTQINYSDLGNGTWHIMIGDTDHA